MSKVDSPAAADHPRIAWMRTDPRAYAAQAGLERYVNSSGLEPTLLELVKLRASSINRCAYCVDMHARDARAAGETEERLYTLALWRETPFFTPRERAALDWTEVVTRIADDGVSDAAYEAARREFDENQLVALTMAIVAINGWNRLSVAFRSPVGSAPSRLERREVHERLP